MFWHKKVQGLSPSQLNDLLRATMEEIRRLEAMGPTQRLIAPLLEDGSTTVTSLKTAIHLLAKAIDDQRPR